MLQQKKKEKTQETPNAINITCIQTDILSLHILDSKFSNDMDFWIFFLGASVSNLVLVFNFTT